MEDKTTEVEVMKPLNFGEIIELEGFFGRDIGDFTSSMSVVGTAYIIMKRRGESTTLQKVMTLDIDVINDLMASVTFEAPKAPTA